ncbi:translocation/assembly module TamB domain-containing protein [Moheibacter sp.]|uniref:translocation/assembly module TamB domain-containing protein n=1 Tax=Moheibacter sp. TaxID=1965316 RepID=UPI003C75ACA6
MKALRRIGRIILIPVIAVLSLLLSAMIAIQIPAVQTEIATYVVNELNETFQTEISVDRVHIDFFGDINLNGVRAKDDHGTQFVDIERLQAKLSLTGLIMEPNRIAIRKLNLYNPEVKVITYKNDSVSNFISLINKFSKSEKEEPSDFKLRGILNVVDGKLLIRNENLEGYKQDWVDATNLNIGIENFRLENNEIWADLNSMNFIGKRNGEIYNIKNLSGKVHYSDKEIRVENMDLETSDSHLNGHVVLSYDSMEDMKDFLNKVNWDMELKDDSKVNFKDIRYFVENFDKNSSVEVRGKVSGTLNNLQLNDFQLSGDGAFIAANELRLLDMTDGANIIIDTEAVKIKTSYQGLQALLPTFIGNTIPDYLNRFGTMNYSGNFNLDPAHINLDGYAITALGDADMRVRLDDYRGTLKYKGTLMADDINLKQITEVAELGFVSGQIQFDGVGTDIKTLRIDAEGKLDYLDLMGKRYQNVAVDGRLERQQFAGVLSVNDPQMMVDYNGIFDFSKKPYRLDFTSKVKYLNLDYLGVTKDMNAKLRADIVGDFTLTNLDDFIGEIQLNNLYFTSKNDTLEVAQAHIASSRNGDVQNLEIDIPGYLRGEINGQYRLSQLPDVIMNSIGSTTLMTYEPKKVDPNQSFNFFFEVEQDLFSMFDQRIQVAPGTILDGQVDTNAKTLIAELSSTEIGYDGINIYNPLINIDTSKDLEQIYLRSDSLMAKGVMVYQLNVHTTPIQDSLLVKTDFHIGKEFPMKFDLNLFHTTDENKNLVFGFSPSTIQIDENNWHLNPNNDKNSNRVIVNFDKNYYELQNLLLESEDQKLLLDGYYASNTDYKLNADLEELVLSKIIPKGLLGNLKIDGIANGNINVVRTKDEFKPLIELDVSQLALNDYGLGDLGMNAVYNVNQNVFDIELFLNQEQVQVLYVNGYIDNKPDMPEINLVASLDDLNFNFVESFLSAAMSNLRGMVSGNMRFTGPIDSPEFEGMLDLANLGFTVDFLNVDYSFDGINTVPVYKASQGQGSITLDEVRFRDTKYNTKGEVSGQLLFRDFASWFLNLSFNTNNLLVMNTSPAQNDLFYGRVFGQGAFSLFGPPERLDISATAIINEGSEFTINTGATKIETGSDLVRFIPEGEKEIDDGTPKGMNIDLDITAFPTTTVNLIFDPVSGDMVTANGFTENLQFNLSRTGNMTMNGVYTLDTGIYKLRQVSLLNRDFEIQPGSYVSWDGGSALNATMNINATYERTVSNVGEYLGAGYSQSYDVVLGIEISETLDDPQMDFTVNIPKAGTDVQSMIDYKFNLDPDEKMIQFGAVLLIGQFMTNTDAVLTAGATSTGAGIALKQLGGIIDSIIAGSGVAVDLDYVTGSNLSQTSDRFKTGLRVDLSPRWTINGALGVAVGNTTGFDDATTVETEIQWDVSRNMDKSMVVNFFTRPTNFGVQNFGGAGNFQSYGAGVIYKTSFDRISEIFKKESNIQSMVLPNVNFDDDPPSLFDLPPAETQDSIREEKKDSVQQKEVSQTTPKKRKSTNSLIRFK